MHGYLAKPEGNGPFPAIVVLHGCDGLHETAKHRRATENKAPTYSSGHVRLNATAPTMPAQSTVPSPATKP